MPFACLERAVEIRGGAHSVQILADAAIVATHPRATRQRIVLDPAHYDGPSTATVTAPVPLGRMGTRLAEIVAQGGAPGAPAGSVCRAGGGGPMNARAAKLRVDLDATIERLQRAGLTHAAERLAERLGEAASDELAPHTMLDRLLDDELNAREERRVRTTLRLSALPTGQTLASFDFSFQPSIERSRIETLATGAWVRAKETLLIQGPPGIGKTHLGVALGVAAVERGFSVFFCRLEELLPQARRGAATGAPASTQVSQRGPADHRRDGLRTHGSRRGQSVLPPGQLPLWTWIGHRRVGMPADEA